MPEFADNRAGAAARDTRPGIAFLGTGIMGAPMCRRLLASGYRVTTWNRTAAKAQALASDGAVVAKSAAGAVIEADIVIVMLSSGPVVCDVLFGEGRDAAAPADGIPRGAAVVIMSSIPVDTTRFIANRLQSGAVHCIDAPVSGGEAGAIAGTLSIMAGGEAGDIARVRAVLECMGRITHVGPSGSGQLAKLANQVIVGLTIDAVAEAFMLAEAGGADLAAVREALTGGFADSTILRLHGRRMIEGDYKPGGHAATQLKDLETARKLAESLGLRLPVLQRVEDLYRAFSNEGGAELDHSALYLYLKRHYG